MDSDSFKGLLWSSVGFVFGIVFFFKGFGTFRRRRLMQNMPTSKVRSIAMGLVEIYGEALKGQVSLTSPFTNNECLYYSYTIEEYRRSGKSSHWETIEKESLGTKFYLRDDTGRVLVDPDGAEVDIPSDYQEQSGIGNPPPLQVEAYLKKRGIDHEGFLGFNKTMRYTEYYIAPSDYLYILGSAGDNPLVEDATAQVGHEDIMIQKGDKKTVYYISDKSEKETLKSHFWKMFFQIYGGAALSIVCLIFFLSILKGMNVL
ncbi:GIDE domain-containing protein [Bdellovibrionota bacterium]